MKYFPSFLLKNYIQIDKILKSPGNYILVPERGFPLFFSLPYKIYLNFKTSIQ